MIIIGLLITGCTERSKEIFKPIRSNKVETKIKESVKVKISCNKGNIDKYIDEGWKIINQESKTTTCSWKSVKSSPKCDIDLDKGCRITVPDKKGEEIEYLLERIK